MCVCLFFCLLFNSAPEEFGTQQTHWTLKVCYNDKKKKKENGDYGKQQKLRSNIA